MSACKKRADSEGAASVEQVDVSADRAAARKGWLVGLAKDPAALNGLADASDGWKQLFIGDPGSAFAAFQKDGATESNRIGQARAALEISDALDALGLMVVAMTPKLLKAQAGRPNAPSSAVERAFVHGRFLQTQAGGACDAATKKAFAALPEGAPLTQLAGLACGSGEPAAVALVAGKAEGIEAELPALASQHIRRLKIRTLVAAGKHKVALRMLRSLRRADADVPLVDGGFQDPGVAGVGAAVYAAQALEALNGLAGWPQILAARAHLRLGAPEKALAALDALIAAPPTAVPFALVVNSAAQDGEDLLAWAKAWRVKALQAAGRTADAKAAAAALPTERITMRVARAWAEACVGLKPATNVFPEDRGVLSRAIRDEISALGEGAKGAADVSDLTLVERHVDAVQRLYADAMAAGGHPARAVKAAETAQDKVNAFAPSSRNRLPALARAALYSLDIDRPRVALKYLTRLKKKLPEVSAPAEMLRDLLSQKAMEQGGDVKQSP